MREAFFGCRAAGRKEPLHRYFSILLIKSTAVNIETPSCQPAGAPPGKNPGRASRAASAEIPLPQIDPESPIDGVVRLVPAISLGASLISTCVQCSDALCHATDLLCDPVAEIRGWFDRGEPPHGKRFHGKPPEQRRSTQAPPRVNGCRSTSRKNKETAGAPRTTVANRPRRQAASRMLLNVGALAPYAVEQRANSPLSRVRSRLDSAGPGHPLGSLDLSGQRPVVVRTPRLTRMPVRMIPPMSTPGCDAATIPESSADQHHARDEKRRSDYLRHVDRARHDSEQSRMIECE